MGDLNLPKSCISWTQSDEGILVPRVASHRDGESLGGKQDRLQAQKLADLAGKFCLSQEVDKPTHNAEVLDLVFTNNYELVNNIEVESFPSFTDHSVVTCHCSYSHKNSEKYQE